MLFAGRPTPFCSALFFLVVIAMKKGGGLRFHVAHSPLNEKMKVKNGPYQG